MERPQANIHREDAEKGTSKPVGVQDNPHYLLLKANEGKVFRLAFSDGEVVVVKVAHVDDEYEDFIFDLVSVVSSTHPQRYTNSGNRCYSGKFGELSSAELEK